MQILVAWCMIPVESQEYEEVEVALHFVGVGEQFFVMSFLVSSPYARKGNVLGGSCSKARMSPIDWQR